LLDYFASGINYITLNAHSISISSHNIALHARSSHLSKTVFTVAFQ